MREEYIARINRVMDYIERNLDQNLSLQELAKIANFSPYHFHRIFGAMTGETLNQFIQRIRLEKAADKLCGNPKIPITNVALDFGFSSSASFARAFKEYFGMSASQYRMVTKIEDRKICKTDRKGRQTFRNLGKDLKVVSGYSDEYTNTLYWRLEMNNKIVAQVNVKELPAMELAYVRHIGPYKGDSDVFEGMFEKLMRWAGPRGLLNFPETQCLSVYHDNPDVTDESKLRTSVCITVPADTVAEGEIGRMSLTAGKYAVAHFEITTDQYQQAWDYICGAWLPESGFQPGDGPAMEIYYNNYKEHPEKKHIVDICIPVKPL